MRAVVVILAKLLPAYLHHLFKIGEILGARLNTIHNIHYYLTLMSEIRQAISQGQFSSFTE